MHRIENIIQSFELNGSNGGADPINQTHSLPFVNHVSILFSYIFVLIFVRALVDIELR